MSTLENRIHEAVLEYHRTRDQARAITAIVELEPELRQYIDARDARLQDMFDATMEQLLLTDLQKH